MRQKIFALVILLAFGVFAMAQSPASEMVSLKNGRSIEKRHGYVGITIGPSIPLGDYADISPKPKVGGNFNMGHFGYLFSKNIGISASVMGGVNPLSYDYWDDDDDYWDDDYWDDDDDWEEDESWTYVAFMAGPMLSFPFSAKVEWDIRPMFGFSVVTTPEMAYDDQGAGLALSLGTALRFNMSNTLALMLTADYLYSEPSFDDLDLKIETLSLGIGLAFRIK